MNEMTVITIFGVIGLIVFAYLIMIGIPQRRRLTGLTNRGMRSKQLAIQ